MDSIKRPHTNVASLFSCDVCRLSSSCRDTLMSPIITGLAVARGFKQREGIDFCVTFAPTPAASCFRLLGALAC